PLKRDLNDDGVVSEAEDEAVRAKSHKLRWRIIVGTAIFAIPCIYATVGMVQNASKDAEVAADKYRAAETAAELA
ncbi:hypothetical protein EVA_22715, partial [gut metagenome]